MRIGSRIDAGLHAVTGDIGKDEMTESEAREMAHELVSRELRIIPPARDLDLAVLGRDIGHDRVSILLGSCLGEGRIAHKRRADRDTPDAERKKLLDVMKGPDAASRIDQDAGRLADGSKGTPVGRKRLLVLAEGTGEVDDVDPGGTCLPELLGDAGRVLAVDIHMGTVALLEPHDLATDQIYRRKEDHRTPPSSTILM